jgi:ribonuclease T1
MAEWKKIASGVGAAALVLAGGYFGLDAGDDNDSAAVSSTGDTCAVDTLPKEADEVIDRILTDQDHLYATHDGKHFGNYEGRLPKERGDYYREYTVVTPGDSSRGARRIVVGGGTENDPDVWYYTDDHYESFCSIPDAED